MGNIFQIPIDSLLEISENKVVGIIGSSKFTSFDELVFLIGNMRDSSIILSGFGSLMRLKAEQFADENEIVLLNDKAEFGTNYLESFVEECLLIVTCGMDPKIELVKRIAASCSTLHSSID